jgi:metacaspase-1
MDAGVSYARGDSRGLLSTGVSLFCKMTRGKKAREKSRRTKSSPADVIQLSGCKDYEKAKDTKANGMMSWAFREVLTQNPNQTYASLLQNVRALLPPQYSQKPVLSSSHPIDTSSRFVI